MCKKREKNKLSRGKIPAPSWISNGPSLKMCIIVVNGVIHRARNALNTHGFTADLPLVREKGWMVIFMGQLGKRYVMTTSYRIFLKPLYFMIVFENIFSAYSHYVLVPYASTSKPYNSVTFCLFLFFTRKLTLCVLSDFLNFCEKYASEKTSHSFYIQMSKTVHEGVMESHKIIFQNWDGINRCV